MKGKKPAPVLVFVNRNPRPTPIIVEATRGTVRIADGFREAPRPSLGTKLQRLADEYPQALYEVEALVDDFIRYLPSSRKPEGGKQ
jgi:hypothetical protein